MDRTYLIIVLLVGSAAAQCSNGGPPTYPCSSTSTSIVQTPTTPPITSTSPTGTSCVGQCLNSVGYDTSLNASGLDPILRVTDGTVLDGHSCSSTPSGGDNDEIWSCTGAATSVACQNASVYFLECYFGGAAYVAALKRVNNTPTVVGPFPARASGANHPTGAGAGVEFSLQDPSIAYLEAAPAGDPIAYKVVYSWDGIQGHSPTFVQTVLFDTAVVCPLPNGAAYGETWSGTLSHDITDDLFAWSSSNVRGMATGVSTATVADGSTVVTVASTAINTAAINAAGTGYVVGDAPVVSGGTLGKLAVLRVSSVGAGGAVTGLTIYGGGAGYSNASAVGTTQGSGTGLKVNITVGLLTDGSYTNAAIKIGNPFVKYTIASNTATTFTLTSAYVGTGCTISCQMQILDGQGSGTYVIAYRISNNSCSVWNTYTGQITSTGAFPTGSIDTGCHNMYLHDGFLRTDGTYSHWSGAETGISCGTGVQFWQTNTLHGVSCTAQVTNGSNGLCGGHSAVGLHKNIYVRNNGFFNVDAATTPASTTPVAPYTTVVTSCDQHFSWRNSVDDTQPVVGTWIDNMFSTSGSASTYTIPYVNELIAVQQNGTVNRFGHNFVLGPGNICGAGNIGPFDAWFTAMYAIGSVSQDGKLFSYSSSMLGQLGTDSDNKTRADIFVVGLDAQVGSGPPPPIAPSSLTGKVTVTGNVVIQ